MLGHHSIRGREETAAQDGVQTVFRLSERHFLYQEMEDEK